MWVILLGDVSSWTCCQSQKNLETLNPAANVSAAILYLEQKPKI